MASTTKTRRSAQRERQTWLESERGGPVEGADGSVMRMTLPEALWEVWNQKNAERRFTLPALTVEQVEAAGYTLDRWRVAGVSRGPARHN